MIKQRCQCIGQASNRRLQVQVEKQGAQRLGLPVLCARVGRPGVNSSSTRLARLSVAMTCLKLPFDCELEADALTGQHCSTVYCRSSRSASAEQGPCHRAAILRRSPPTQNRLPSHSRRDLINPVPLAYNCHHRQTTLPPHAVFALFKRTNC